MVDGLHDSTQADDLRLESLVDWLETQHIVLARPARAERIGGGRSNLTYAVTDADGRCLVVRRPPHGALLENAHDMGREWRFITALDPTEIPVATPLAMCEDPDVLGAPFYVMSYVEGIVAHDAEAGSALMIDARRRYSDQIVEVLAALHAVDLEAVGLSSMARPGNYLDRQLRRWKRNWDLSNCTDLSVADELHHRLSSSVPDSGDCAPTLVHGDYRPGNLLCSSYGAIRAVLDWELATVGDPLADLGWLLADWATPAGEPTAHVIAPTSTLEGFTTRDEITSRYAEVSGRDVSAINYYVAFAHWRGACVVAGMATRQAAGVMGEDEYTRVHAREQISMKAQAALAFLDRMHD